MRSHCDLPQGEINIYTRGSSDPHGHGYSQVAQPSTLQSATDGISVIIMTPCFQAHADFMET